MIKRLVIVLAGTLLVAFPLSCVFFYKLYFYETAIVTTLGAPSEPLNGATDAGLKFRWPWPIQVVFRYPARLMTAETSNTQRSTKDGKSLLVTSYCTWRIVDAGRFHRVGKTVDEMRDDLRKRLASSMADAIGGHLVGDFVNTDPTKMALSEIEQEVLTSLRAGLLERVSRPVDETSASAPASAHSDSLSDLENPYGIEVVNVGIKMLGLPKTATQQVIASMRDEREAEANRLREQGANRATAIRERARAAREKILAFAQRKAESIQSEGYRAAADLYPEFQKHEEFAMFLRALKSLERELQGRSVFILDGSRVPAIKFFRNGPMLPPRDDSGSIYSIPKTPKTKQETP